MTTHILDPFLALRAERPMLVPQRRIRVKCADDVELLVGVFEPEPQQVQDVLLFFHGAGAHMAAGYLDLGAELHQASRCAVLLPDLRGHGRSGGARGELDAAPKLWRDVDALVLPDEALSENLLGMSYLSKLRRFEVANGKLVMEQ